MWCEDRVDHDRENMNRKFHQRIAASHFSIINSTPDLNEIDLFTYLFD